MSESLTQPTNVAQPSQPAATNNPDKVSPQTKPDPNPAQQQTTIEWPQLLCIKGKTMVPLRAFALWLGAETSFDPKANVFTITKDNQSVSLHLGDTAATVNGKLVATNVPTREINGIGYGQFGFVADVFTVKYAFNEKTNALTITHPNTNITSTLQVKMIPDK